MLGDQFVDPGKGIPAMDHDWLVVIDRKANLGNERGLLGDGVGEIAIKVQAGLPHRRNAGNHRAELVPLVFPPIGFVRMESGRGDQAIRVGQGQFDRTLGAGGIDAGHHHPRHFGGAGKELLGRTTVKLKVTVCVEPPQVGEGSGPALCSRGR